MAYCTIQNMVDRFGEKEIACIADRSLTRTGVLFDSGPNQLRVQNAINDACALIDMSLGCCFNMQELKTLLDEGKVFGSLVRWNSDVARYFLYDDIDTGKAQGFESKMVERRYEIVKSEIKKLCSCNGALCSTTGECIYTVSDSIEEVVVEERLTCWPEKSCCNANNCTCGKCHE